MRRFPPMRPILTACLLAASAVAAQAADLTRQAIEEAQFTQDATFSAGERSAIAFRLQVLLDRANLSPGIIDGYFGENVQKAVRTFEQRAGLEPDGQPDAELWTALGGTADIPLLSEYEISQDDVDGPFVESIPDDFEALAEMERLAYTSPAELLAEKFHLHIDVLKMLNPDADFSQAGTKIVVPVVGTATGQEIVTRIEVDKEMAQVRGYGEGDQLIVAYPATIGSSENPSPSGTWQVEAAVEDPPYTYRPEVFDSGPDEALELPPGPNGPVGSIWIDLGEEGYGIHGTAEPAAIDKTQSHGCVRLTNWDAEELADLVKVGAEVKFLETSDFLNGSG